MFFLFDTDGPFSQKPIDTNQNLPAWGTLLSPAYQIVYCHPKKVCKFIQSFYIRFSFSCLINRDAFRIKFFVIIGSRASARALWLRLCCSRK